MHTQLLGHNHTQLHTTSATGTQPYTTAYNQCYWDTTIHNCIQPVLLGHNHTQLHTTSATGTQPYTTSYNLCYWDTTIHNFVQPWSATIFACIFFSVQSVSIKCTFNQNSVTPFRAVGRLRLPDKAYVYSCELIELLLTHACRKD